MTPPGKKTRFTPMEVAQKLGISVKKFTEEVADGNLPKGRMGEDGRRYYTIRDIEFIERKWKSKTTVHFMMFTLPLILIAVIFILIISHQIGKSVAENEAVATPTIPVGYGAPPPLLFEVTPEPTLPPRPTAPPKTLYDDYRSGRSRNRQSGAGDVNILPP